MSAEAHGLISSLLVADPSKRLGGGSSGVRVIVAHPFFEPIAPVDDPPLWKRQSPFVPQLKHEADTSHFDMTTLTKVEAERMRSQLEGDHGTFTNTAQTIRENLEAEDRDADGNSNSDDDENDSFKTFNVEVLARMQLQEASEGTVVGGEATSQQAGAQEEEPNDVSDVGGAVAV